MPPQTPRVALIHATPLAIEPIAEAFTRHWPQAQLMNLLDDSLSVDRARDGKLTDPMTLRFVDLALYAVSAGCHAILFTCSAFGPAIEAAGNAAGVPTLKPNDAMFEQALALAQPGTAVKLGLVATFQSSIASMSEELMAMAVERDISVDLHTVFVAEAMDDLAAGRTDDHHRKIAEACAQLSGCDAVMLAQFSMAAAQPVVQAGLKCPVLSSPDCAVMALQHTVYSHP